MAVKTAVKIAHALPVDVECNFKYAKRASELVGGDGREAGGCCGGQKRDSGDTKGVDGISRRVEQGKHLHWLSGSPRSLMTRKRRFQVLLVRKRMLEFELMKNTLGVVWVCVFSRGGKGRKLTLAKEKPKLLTTPGNAKLVGLR